MSRESRYYTQKFYDELKLTQESAREILPLLTRALAPKSIIDVGCGTGHWLAAAIELGLHDVVGVDGAWVKSARLAIPTEHLVVHDLATPLRLSRRFDLALSLEVAEHLPESSARGFVRDLCDLSDVVAFSAAIPGQGGRRHRNEQWPSYWAELFREKGFDCYDFLRPRIWENPQVAWYYAQNCLVFARRGLPGELGEAGPPFPLVHPRLWSAQLERLDSPAKLLERLPKAVFRRIRRRFQAGS